MKQLTLTGNLGRAPQLRQTRERTITVKRPNRVAQLTDTFEVRTRSRDYIRFSLAYRPHPAAKGRWYHCVVWNGDLLAYRAIRWAHQGDLVRITGRPEVYRYWDAKGIPCSLYQIVISDFKVLVRSRKHPVPEYP
jgi:single-stranded DNA-binding protein